MVARWRVFPVIRFPHVFFTNPHLLARATAAILARRNRRLRERCLFLPDKGKPVARRGRNAMGPGIGFPGSPGSRKDEEAQPPFRLPPTSGARARAGLPMVDFPAF